MWLYVQESHQTLGAFPTFSKGTKIENKAPCERYAHWYSCIKDHQTYVAECLIHNDCLITDYNPTELTVQTGEKVLLITICYEWALVKNQTNQIGWLPLAKLYGKQNAKTD